MSTETDGMCQCGCGARAPLAKYTDKRTGTVKGEPTRFIKGHIKKVGRIGHIVDPDTGCWITLSTPISGGYCRVRIGGKAMLAHRLAYEKAKGPIPNGLVIDHLCRNRRCCNPDHLEAVPPEENLRRAHTVKLTMEIAVEIRRLRNEGATLKSIAAIFGVCESQIGHVCNNRRWVIYDKPG